MEKKSWELSETSKKMIKDTMIYKEYINQQKKYFIQIMHYVDRIINEMVDNGEISLYGEIRARIKSVNSALKNDEFKAVDDAFGIEIITATEFEYTKIIESLKEIMTVQKDKEHNKDNGYKARHMTMTLNKENLFALDIPEANYEYVPMIEYQFKTFQTLLEIEYGRAGHGKYKNEDEEEMQRKYDNNMYSNEEIAETWVSIGGKMVKLSKEEAFLRNHPYVKRNREKEKSSQ